MVGEPIKSLRPKAESRVFLGPVLLEETHSRGSAPGQECQKSFCEDTKVTARLSRGGLFASLVLELIGARRRLGGVGEEATSMFWGRLAMAAFMVLKGTV